MDFNINDYGFTNDFNPENKAGTPARVTAVHKGRYGIVSQYGDGYDYKKQKQQWEKALRIGDKKRKKERF